MNLRRKRMMLMDGQWYGYLRTASGNPLTLQAAKRLRSLTVYGNAVQDGTPSPDAPVEVQLCGDRTGNLFDKKHASNIDNWELSTSKDNGYYELQGIANGETITIALKLNSTLAVNSGIWVYTYDDVYKTGFNPQTTELQTTTMTYADGDYMRLYVPGTNGAVKNYMNLVDADLQIIRGSYTADTLPAYEPYGYKISGRAEGLNLFTAEGRTVSDVADSAPSSTRAFGDNVIVEAISSNGYIASRYQTPDYQIYGNTIEVYPASGSGYGIGFDFNVTEGERYSLSFTVLIGKANFSMSYYDADGVYLKRAHLGTNTVGVFSSTVPSGAKKMILTLTESYGQTAHHIKVTDIMLVQGSYTAETMPPYEPYQPPQDFAVYLPEQIAKVGDVADEVVVDMEKKTAELRKNVRSEAFTGGEDWYTTREPTDTQCYYVADLTPKKVNAALSSLSSHFVPTTAITLALNEAKVQSFVNGTAWYGACVDAAVYPDVASFKQFVTEQYSEGNPLTVYHAIEPVTTDITSLQQWDAMPQVSGTVTLTLSAEVDPSGAEAVYYSKERGE